MLTSVSMKEDKINNSTAAHQPQAQFLQKNFPTTATNIYNTSTLCPILMSGFCWPQKMFVHSLIQPLGMQSWYTLIMNIWEVGCDRSRKIIVTDNSEFSLFNFCVWMFLGNCGTLFSVRIFQSRLELNFTVSYLRGIPMFLNITLLRIELTYQYHVLYQQ